jgi:signal peptidase I
MNLMQGNDPENEVSSSEHEEAKINFAAELWDWTKSILLALAIVFIIHQFIFNLSKVEGHSMEPTLEDKERLFVNKIVYLIGEPNYNNVVILKDPRGGKQFLVKRIVAVSGDTVEIRNQQLFVNGEKVDEPYIAAPIEGRDYGPITVDEGHYFVMGDNRHFGESLDSRDFGAVRSDLIKGRAEYILWPITKMDKL